MGDIIDIRAFQNLFFKGDRRVFVTVCTDGMVVYKGCVISLAEATKEVLGYCPADYKTLWVAE